MGDTPHSPPQDPTFLYAKALRGGLFIFTLLFIFFARSTYQFYRLLHQFHSPIHALALLQAVMGMIVQIFNILYAFLILSCSFFTHLNTLAVGLAILLLVSIIAIQVFYLHRSRPLIIALIPVAILSSIAITLWTVFAFDPVFNGDRCITAFPTIVPTLKLSLDLLTNLLLGSLTIHAVRKLAFESDSTFWHHLLLERTYCLILVLICNIVTAALIISRTIGSNTNILYYVDWVAMSSITMIQLLSAQSRRDQRARGSLNDDDDNPSIPILSTMNIQLDSLSNGLAIPLDNTSS